MCANATQRNKTTMMAARHSGPMLLDHSFLSAMSLRFGSDETLQIFPIVAAFSINFAHRSRMHFSFLFVCICVRTDQSFISLCQGQSCLSKLLRIYTFDLLIHRKSVKFLHSDVNLLKYPVPRFSSTVQRSLASQSYCPGKQYDV